MVYGVYSMRDKHVGFMEPRLDVNDQSAIRNFASALKNAPAESILGFAPVDFDLYKLGTFDTEKGMYNCFGVPEFLISGSSVVGGSYEKEI